MTREPVKMLSFSFAFIVLHVIIHIGIICFWFAALAEDYNVRDTACDDTFHMFKYCGFNGSGFLLSLLTYFILKTGEAARARAAALAIMHCGCATWGLATWDDLADTACETVYRDHYEWMWIYWNTLVCANCFYGVAYMLHELVWSRYSNVDLTVACEAQSAEEQAKANRPVNLYGVPGVPSGGYQGVPAQSEPQPLHPELQAEYQKVVAGIEYRASQSLPSSVNGQPNLGRLPSAQPNLGFLPNAQPNLGLLPNPQPDSQP